MISNPSNPEKLGMFSLKASVIALFMFFSCLRSAEVVAGYAAIHVDETALTKKQQNRRNILSYTGIIAANSTYVVGTVAGFVPEPTTSYAGEISALIADNTLKFTKPVLYAPQDIVRMPNTADNCRFEFDLAQTTARWDNILGLWPKLGNDAIFNPFDEPISFGELGQPVISHANTEANLNIFIPSALEPVSLSTNSQKIILGPGVHHVEWRGDTLWFPIWDTVFPGVLTVFSIASEVKWAKYLKKLKKFIPKKGTKAAKKGSKTALRALKSNTKKLVAKLNKLNKKLNIFAKIKKAVKKFRKKHPNATFYFDTGKGLAQEFTEGNKEQRKEDVIAQLAQHVDAESLVRAMFAAQNTVSRSRVQTVTVYDLFPPTLSTMLSEITFEASDPDGARASRYLNNMRDNITASDGCGRPITLVNDAPDNFPLGETLVTWKVQDLGPALPNIDHDGDGVVDNDSFFTRSVTQLITIEDTQAPLLVAPPAIVTESADSIDLSQLDLGLPLVVDLVDLHPTVSSSSNSVDGIIIPNTRTLVTWSATDHATKPNTTTVSQLVTVKTPGTNSSPSVLPQTVKTLTSHKIDIILTGTDPDELPMTGAAVGDPLVTDPLKFKIEQSPVNGEFVAPLYPYFINDYRTDSTGVLTDDVAFAKSTDQLNWLKVEYCDAGNQVPINFIYNPLFVKVTDSGEQYFLDSYAVCFPNGTGSPEIESRLRISHWDSQRNFLGHIDYNPSNGTHNSSFVLDPNGKIYYLVSFGVNEYSLQSCDSNIVGTKGSCSGGYNYSSNDGGIDISRTKYARVDSTAANVTGEPLVYLTDGHQVNIYQGQQYKGRLVNDAGTVQFLENSLTCQPIPGAGSNQGYGMEVDSKGNFYIADTCGDRIHKFLPSTLDSNGTLQVGAYAGWMGQCSSSTDLACDENLKISKGYSCTDATCSVSGDGSGSEGGQFLDPVYLAMDPNDILYVADYGNQSVQRFATDGTFSGRAKSVGNGVNAQTEGGFVLGNMGPPRTVSVNSKQFFVVDQNEKFVHVFDASPFKDITDSSATVTYVSEFSFHSDTDTFSYSVNDGLVDSNSAMVSIDVARNYRQPLPTTQNLTIDEDYSRVIILSGSDADGILDRDFNGLDSLIFSITKQPKFGVLTPGGDVGNIILDPGQQAWTYTPNRDFNGQDSFSFTVADGFTNLTSDGSTEIPVPYGVAEAADVVIKVNSINDVPVVRISAPDRVAAGFPMMIDGSVTDDISEAYFARLNWGDGQIEGNGEIIVDDNGTVGDTTDDSTTLTGVIFSQDGLTSTGESSISAMKTYTTPGTKNIELCMLDKEKLESCSTISALVESLVVLSGDVQLSTDKVADGVSFDARFSVKNAVPSNGVSGLNADNVSLKIDIPQGLLLQNYSSDTGSCSVLKQTDQLDQLICNFGNMNNGASALVDTQFRGKGTLIYSDDFDIDGEINTDSDALQTTVVSSASILLNAVSLDRDNDGLPNIFEAFYHVSDPDADDDNDGLTNLQEFEQGTSPIVADSDGDGINDGDEVNLYGTDPTEKDSDADGISDGDEISLYLSNPLDRDSDGDGLSDTWEVDNGFNLILADSLNDFDGDGLTDLEEFQLDTNYQLADTDGDTLSDGDEVNLYKTSPVLVDSDGDGLNDNLELENQTDPLKSDSDDDGLSDGTEVNDYFSLPLNADTDRDGLPDGWETRHGRDLLVADYQIAAGGLSSCAKTDNGVECWGRNHLQQAPAQVAGLNNAKFISMGFAHGCAIDVAVDGRQSVSCWGDDGFNQSTPPALINPVEISSGAYHSCVIDKIDSATRVVKCWGRNNFSQVSAVPTNLENPVNLVSSISGNSNCVVDNKSTGAELTCWGQYNDANSAIPSQLFNPLAPLALGSEHGCVVDQGVRQCWGLNDDGQAPPEKTVTNSIQLSLGGFHSCALNPAEGNGNQVSCWGRPDDNRTLVPSTLKEPLQLASGSHHSCAFDQGSAKCWGLNIQQQAPAQRKLNIDPDNDNVITATEISNGTNPLDADTDHDGLSDDLEIEFQTDPLSADSDDDGVSDGDEVNRYSTNPRVKDTDGDGMPDGWEIDRGLSATSNDASLDSDSDGLSNRAEFLNNTNPSNADSDGDGLTDGAELAQFKYVDRGETLGTNSSVAVKLADIDNDGDVDAMVSNFTGGGQLWNNDGDGHFSQNTATVFDQINSRDLALIDIDGDDDLDVYFANFSAPDSLWINAADGDPEGVFRVSDQVFANSHGRAVAVGKFNPFTTWPGLFLAEVGANQNINFDANQIISGSMTDFSNSDSQGVAVGDLNGDGNDDAFVANYNQPNQVFFSVAEAATMVVIDDSNQSLGSQLSHAVALGDLDGDGDLDAYVANSQSDFIWLNNGNGVFSDSGQRLGKVADNDISYDVKLFDIDGDGDLDALVANDALGLPDSGSLKIWLNDGSGVMSNSNLVIGSSDSRGMSLGDVDNDGLTDVFLANDGANTIWLLKRLDPNTPDTDGDGAFDGWEIDNGFDPLNDSDGELDDDNDGLSNAEEFAAGSDPKNSDTDRDGMPDGWEIDNGLDPLVDDSNLDLDNDGLTNLQEYQQGNVPEADDVAPVVIAPIDLQQDSTGVLTAVEIGNATANDARDGVLTSSVDNLGPYVSGRTELVWTASDLSGNVGMDNQLIDVKPQVNLPVDQVVVEGATVRVMIELNGNAVKYPVDIDYLISGDAKYPEDHDAVSSTVRIESGTKAEILIHIVKDAIFEHREEIIVTIDKAVNAVLGTSLIHKITILDQNVKPSAQIISTQQNKRVTTVVQDLDNVLVSANISDPNPDDSHTLDWSLSDSGVFDSGDPKAKEYQINPLNLNTGIYNLILKLEDNGIPAEQNTEYSLLKVIDTLPNLSAEVDTDGDGTNDLQEGMSDLDGDRVPDYLDANNASNLLLLNQQGYLLEAQTGLNLKLGKKAFSIGWVAEISEQALGQDIGFEYTSKVADFVIDQLDFGQSVKIVFPLSNPISQHSVYKQFIDSGWMKFVNYNQNILSSAPGDNGACPPPNDLQYIEGLVEGNSCIQLQLNDGGPNDGDGQQNGVISNSSGLAVPVEISMEMISVSDKTVSVNSSNNVFLGLRFQSKSGGVEINSLTLQLSGNGDLLQISAVNVFVDVNGNGIVDASDTKIGNGNYVTNSDTLELQITEPYQFPVGHTDLIVTYNF